MASERRKSTELIEYLYIDHKRLDAYVSQLAAPKTYDKVPTWTVEAGLTGLKAGGQQSKLARDRTLQEKIDLLVGWLEKNDRLSTKRPTCYSLEGGYGPDTFCTETIAARKVSIPPRRSSIIETGFTLWVSVSEKHPESLGNDHALVLCEDFPLSDEPGPKGMGLSHFSALIYLVTELREQLCQTPILTPDVKEYMESHDEYKWLQSDDFFLAAINTAIQGEELVDSSPIRLLKKLGCHLADERFVRVLYRPRTVNDVGKGVFGYPIFVAEASAAQREQLIEQRRQTIEKRRATGDEEMKRRFYRYDGD